MVVLLGPAITFSSRPTAQANRLQEKKVGYMGGHLFHWGEEEAKGSLFLHSLVIKKDVGLGPWQEASK